MHSARRSTFPPSGMVAERSSPSRVRCAAQNAPLTAPGRSARCSARKEGGLEERQQQKQHQNRKLPLDLDGILMEGVIATLRLLFGRQAKGKRKLVISFINISNDVSCVKGLGLLAFVVSGTRFT